jgi:hypothetical protein
MEITGALFLALNLGASSPVESPQTMNPQSTQTLGCRVIPNPEYDNKIREYTTEPFFKTELVDHLPSNSCVPSPDRFLKHIVGAPGVLTYSKDIETYMHMLERSTPRVKVYGIGKSEEGREMLAVAISDEHNIADIDRYAGITARLADPRGISEEDAHQLISQALPFYWVSGSIHSPEAGAPEMLMELAYRLAVEESSFIQQIRKSSIVLITPVSEVDGHDRFVDTYMYRKAHPDQEAYPTTWWGHYVGHDNNRDAMTMSLALTRNMMQAFFRFHPTVMHDLHESMPFLYISTGTGPYNAWLDPIVIDEWHELAYYEIGEMTKRGVPGVWTHGYYDGWAPNCLFFIANSHNSIGRFYETYGNGGADTHQREPGDIQTSRLWYRPNPPLPRVRWSLRDNVNLQQSALLLGIHNVAINRQHFLNNFYLKSKRSIEKAVKEGPAAWIFPGDDPRKVGQSHLLNILNLQGVEIRRASQAFKVRNYTSTNSEKIETSYPPGTYIVRMDQPYSRIADMLLDTQYYSPQDPPPFDDSGWTLGALQDVKTVRVTDRSILNVPMTRVYGPIAVTGAIEGTGKTYLINHSTENTLATLRFALPNTKVEVAEEPFSLDSMKFKAGTFIIRNVDRMELEQKVKDLGLTAVATDKELDIKTHHVGVPSVALLHNWVDTQNDGWFRIAFDHFRIPYQYLADTTVREMPDLRQHLDVVIIPPMGITGGNMKDGLSMLIRGLPRRGGPMPWKNTPEMPNLVAPGLDTTDDMRGGLGYTGLANLEKFVEEGGLLVAIQSSAMIAVATGMTQMVSVSDPKEMRASGSVVKAIVDDATSPITYGYNKALYVYFKDSPILKVGLPYATGSSEPGTRTSGRGSLTDPDIPQAQQYIAPEKPVNDTVREQELEVPDVVRQYMPWLIPSAQEIPRVVLCFASKDDLVLSGQIVGRSEMAEKPAVVDVPHGKGHVVLFAINPMWRNETDGSYFLLFNAILNFDHLNAGRAISAAK